MEEQEDGKIKEEKVADGEGTDTKVNVNLQNSKDTTDGITLNDDGNEVSDIATEEQGVAGDVSDKKDMSVLENVNVRNTEDTENDMTPNSDDINEVSDTATEEQGVEDDDSDKKVTSDLENVNVRNTEDTENDMTPNSDNINEVSDTATEEQGIAGDDKDISDLDSKEVLDNTAEAQTTENRDRKDFENYDGQTNTDNNILDSNSSIVGGDVLGEYKESEDLKTSTSEENDDGDKGNTETNSLAEMTTDTQGGEDGSLQETGRRNSQDTFSEEKIHCERERKISIENVECSDDNEFFDASDNFNATNESAVKTEKNEDRQAENAVSPTVESANGFTSHEQSFTSHQSYPLNDQNQYSCPAQMLYHNPYQSPVSNVPQQAYLVSPEQQGYINPTPAYSSSPYPFQEQPNHPWIYQQETVSFQQQMGNVNPTEMSQPISHSENICSYSDQNVPLQEEVPNNPESDQEQQALLILQVSGFGKNVSVDTLKSYFCDEGRSGGGEIKEIKLNPKTKRVNITFCDVKVAQRVLRKKKHKIKKDKLKVEMLQQSTSDEEIEKKPKTTILVKWQGKDLTVEEAEILEMYFENKRKSGGENVTNFDYNKKKKEIYITFEDEKVTQRVLAKSPHCINKRTLKVELLDEAEEEEKTPKLLNTVMVTWEGKNITKDEFDVIELYFESQKKSGGGTISEFKPDKKKKIIYISFQDETVAQRVLSRQSHQIGKRTLQVQPFDASTTEETKTKKSVVVKSAEKKIEEDETEFMEMYFENKRKSGGGSIEEIKLRKGVLYITFEEDGVAEKVVQRQHKVCGRNLEVTVAGEDTETEAEEEKEEVSGEENEARTTVVIKGCGSISDESVSLYFENKKRGGGVQVKDIDRDEEGLMYVTFESVEDVETVLKKSHTIEGNRVTIKPYQPPQMYKDKILLTNVPESSTTDTITNFIEARSHYDVADDGGILFGEDVGTVLVSFTKPIDFEKLSKNLTSKQFKGKILQVKRIPISKGILVKDFGDVTPDAIQMYFENERRSGGKDVTNVEIDSERKCAVVTFEDENVVSNVLKQKEHKLSSHKIEVSRYHKCLGLSGGTSETNWDKVPDPFFLDNINRYKIMFIEENLSHFQNTLKNYSAEALLDSESNQIEIRPTFTMDSPGSRNIAATWTDDVKSSAQHFIHKIEVQRIGCSADIWTDMKKNIESKELSKLTEYKIFYDDEKYDVIIVGQSLGDMAEEIKNTCTDLTAKFERTKRIRTETKTFSACKLRILKDSGFITKLEEIFEDVKIDVNNNENVTITGVPEEISHLFCKIYDENEKIKQKDFEDFPEFILQLLQQPEVGHHLHRKLLQGENRYLASWEASDRHVTIYSLSEADMNNTKTFLENSIKKRMNELDHENLPLVNASSFKDKVSEIEQKYEHQLKVVYLAESSQIVVAGVGEDVNAAMTEMNSFIQENSIYTETANLSRNEKKFIVKHCQMQIDEIKQRFRHNHVKIICEECKSEYVITIKATKNGLTEAETGLNTIVDQIFCTSQSFDKPGIKTFLTDDFLRSVEKKNRCVIDWDDKYYKEMENCKIKGSCSFPGEIMLHIVHGSLVGLSLKHKINVVVIEANTDLSPASEEAKLVLKQAKLDSLSEAQGELTEGDIHPRNSGNFDSKIIIQAVGPTPDSLDEPRNVIRSTLMKCFEYTSENNYSTIAFAMFKGKGITTNLASEERITAFVSAVCQCFQHQSFSGIEKVYVTEKDSFLVHQLMAEFRETCEDFNEGEMFSESSHLKGNPKHSSKKRVEETEQEPEVPLYTEELDPASILEVNGLTRILITETDMGKEESDVLVNSSNTSLELSSGAVSKSILEHSGPKVQEECKSKYPNGIKMGDVAVTGPGNLPCVMNIYHVCLPDFKENGKTVLENTIKKILNMAVDSKLKTVAIPALGTGILKYPRELVAELMYKTVLKFIEESPEDSLRDIKFVLHPSDEKTIQVFKAEAKKHLKKVPKREEVLKEAPKSEIHRVMKPKPKPSQNPDIKVKREHLEVKRSSANSSVTLNIYSDNKSDIAKAVKFIFDEYDKQVKTKTMDEKCIIEWDDEMINDIKNIPEVSEVDITVNKPNGKIVVKGLQKAVLEASSKIQEVIRENEKLRQETENAKNLAKVVQWYTVGTDEDGKTQLDEYEIEINFKIDKAYSAGDEFYWFDTDDGKYVIDFNKWLEYPKDEPDEALTVLRKNLLESASIQLPDHWSKMEKDMTMEKIDNSTEEYKKVETEFTTTIDSEKCKIIRIDRIQSRTLYQQYKMRAEKANKDNPNKTNEKSLWHGTECKMQTSIAAYGFNRSFCNQNVNDLGQGVYFTVKSALALSKYCKEEDKKKYLFLSKVITGVYSDKISPSDRVPPFIDEASKKLHDSVVDNTNDPETFVIFNDTQAYPEYMLTVKCE